jgi:hypothetical protein
LHLAENSKKSKAKQQNAARMAVSTKDCARL